MARMSSHAHDCWQNPCYAEYLADEMSYYPDCEPESLFVAELDGRVVGALLGAMDIGRFERVYQRKINP
jgi:hypothetical protein